MGKWFGLSFALALAATETFALDACQDDTIHLRGDWGTARFSIDLADTPEERSRGLMFVEDMPRMFGMLFVYDREQTVSFWMKNTLIPLDMIFADSEGVVQRIHSNAVPGDLTAIPGGSNIQFVLEINGGMADRLGMDVGTEMRHPAIPTEDAAWPCGS
ncbi:DUF192 domain-containing protein [Marivita hallyeonensis]|uniref:DUF192 domain-containing protein n=1 Tax=Marivita hallyeonensis TaxID=996342 RepID=A0A1M5QWM0_9RHOB|nr:DUF192 domain-containing protein [Marivita hallyeonensis]SHH18567.1 hypothetical protein SAMN05443551_1528 [Marivita hallyeonensis]